MGAHRVNLGGTIAVLHRRLAGLGLSLVLTLLGLLLVTFVIGRVMPIDPVLLVALPVFPVFKKPGGGGGGPPPPRPATAKETA
ncbi:hypothetical protein VB636_02755, partial [Paracoccus sp. APAP_BH8]